MRRTPKLRYAVVIAALCAQVVVTNGAGANVTDLGSPVATSIGTFNGVAC